MSQVASLKESEKFQDLAADALLRLDFSTFFHCVRVEKLAGKIGKRLKLSSGELSQLKWGALLHDIGKQNIPPEILNKTTPLTAADWALIQEHPVHGYQFARMIGMDETVCRIILHHHIWADGTGGYPSGENMRPCLLTQITTVADVVDAMTSDRPYRPPLSTADCIEHLEAHLNTRYNPDAVEVVKEILFRK